MVYVDTLKTQYGRMKMSHMLADTVDELHAMADRIGLKREWFQDPAKDTNVRTPHYDVCQAMKAKALAAGAVECDRKKVVEIIRKFRAEARNG